MNKVILTGFLGRDPEITTSKSGDMQIAKFSLAVNSGYGDKKKTNWINCTAFGKSAEALGKYIFKGSPITIEGHIQTGSYEKKDGTKVYTTDVIIDQWEFAMRDKHQDEHKETETESATELPEPSTKTDWGSDDSSLPF